MLRTESIRKTQKLLLLSFLLPFSIMAIIYVFMGVYPFGNNTLLTIDLGQQYVDFYSYYRHTLLEEPQAIFYSFVKGIGGEMVGVWGYYLNSPFNLLLLLFPQRYLPVGVTLLILLKISSSGLSFAYLLIKKFDGQGYLVPTFAVSYALMGYTIANQLNVMWLDGLILLPLIVLGVEKLIDGEKGFFYTVTLAIMLFSHYYIAYMICLFICFYFLFALSKQEQTKGKNFSERFIFYCKKTISFAFHSILGACLVAFSLLPNFVSLLGGKASYTSDAIDWSLEYPFPEVLSKFYIGSFNFDQLPSGHPNLFIGTIALVGFLFYFFNRQFSLKERMVALAVTVFFFLSMNVQILNKAWHGFQNPIWYPYRFSFVVCFFFILNGFRSIQKNKSFPLSFACLLLILQTGSALYVLEQDFEFVIPIQVLTTVLFLIFVLVLFLVRESAYKWMPYVLLLTAVVEMSTNAAINLTRLSYVKMAPFNDYQLVLNDMLANVRPKKDEFYRIEKVFQRSKNDSFQANYPSASHFSSTFEKEVPELYSYLGFPEGNGFVSYSTGTLFTDAFFGIRYLFENKPLSDEFQNSSSVYKINANSTRPDLSHYQKIADHYRTTGYLNENALSFIFAAPEEILDVRLKENNPISNQENILKALSLNVYESPFYTEEGIRTTITENISSPLQGSLNKTYTKDDSDKSASIELQFVPETNDPYYLILDSRIDDEDAKLRLNGEDLSYYKTYRSDQIINVASNQNDQTIRFGFELLKDTLTIRDMKLYRFNQEQFEEVVAERKKEGITLTSFSQTNIEGTIKIAQDNPILLITIPFSEGWDVLVDGEKVNTFPVLGSLLGASIEPGDHHIQLKYKTPYLAEGMWISVGAFSVVLLLVIRNRKNRS